MTPAQHPRVLRVAASSNPAFNPAFERTREKRRAPLNLGVSRRKDTAVETILAWSLPVVAVGLLIQAFAKLRSPIGHAIATYVAFSILFGCLHFLYYRHSPTSYIVSKDIPIPAAAQAAIDIQKPLEADLKGISILDALLFEMAQPSERPPGPLRFDQQTKHHPRRYPHIDIDTWVRFTLVGPRRDEPVYAAMVRITIAEDYRGIKSGTTEIYRVAAPDSSEVTLEEAQFMNAILGIRKSHIEHVEEMFEPGTMTPALFSLWDFFYFSFSIVGVGEVIPRSTFVRMLVWLQVLCTLVIPITLERLRARDG